MMYQKLKDRWRKYRFKQNRKKVLVKLTFYAGKEQEYLEKLIK